MRTSANWASSAFEAVVFEPTSLPKAAVAAERGSLAMICLGVTSLARIKPLARAVAILPAPRKPMVSLEGMGLCNSWEGGAKGKDYPRIGVLECWCNGMAEQKALAKI